MATTNGKEFPPCKPVPVGEPILVYFSGKPPRVKEFKKKVRDQQGNVLKNPDGTDQEVEIRPAEARVWMGIADSNFPEWVGQFHEFFGRPWIAPASTTGEGAKQPTKWYATIEAMAGPEVAQEAAYKDALLIDDGTLDEREVAKVLPDEWWKKLRGFYVAYFKEPVKDKETGAVRLDKAGGVEQHIKEIKHPKALRWDVDKVKLWPPPEKPIGMPTGKTAPKQQSEAPQEEPKQPKAAPKPISEVDEELRAWIQPGTNFLAITRGFLSKHSAQRVSLMDENKRRHLWALLMIETYLTVKDQGEAAQYRAKVNEYLKLRNCTGLLELDRLDVDLLLGNLEDIAAGVPF